LKEIKLLFHFNEFYFRRIPVSQIPYEDEVKCAQWLHELFQEKVIFNYKLYYTIEENIFSSYEI